MIRKNFSINQNNQLLVKSDNIKKPVVIDGSFYIDKGNNLCFLLNEPVIWRRDYDLPNKIRFKGSWRLNDNHDLELNLDKTENQFKDDCLLLGGKIISVEQENIVFQIKTHNKRGVDRFSFLKLSGNWQSDEFNRIVFQVKKGENPDTLVLKNAWQMNRNQQIIYEYEKTDLKTKQKINNTLTFTGFWQISSASRLSYFLSRSSHSCFDFRVQLESPNIYPKKNRIKYRLGVGIRDDLKPLRMRIITLYGTWKFSRRLGLSFEMDYGEGRFNRLFFNTEVDLSQRNKIIFNLTDTRGNALGISVVFSHRFLNKSDYEWFIRLKKDSQEKKVETGVRLGF